MTILFEDKQSPAAKRAHNMGLDYLGFGKWGKQGRAQYKTDDGINLQRITGQPADQAASSGGSAGSQGGSMGGSTGADQQAQMPPIKIPTTPDPSKQDNLDIVYQLAKNRTVTDNVATKIIINPVIDNKLGESVVDKIQRLRRRVV